MYESIWDKANSIPLELGLELSLAMIVVSKVLTYAYFSRLKPALSRERKL